MELFSWFGISKTRSMYFHNINRLLTVADPGFQNFPVGATTLHSIFKKMTGGGGARVPSAPPLDPPMNNICVVQ